MGVTAATTAPSALWYLTRGTGATALILLTVSVALGVLNVRRTTLQGVPRFVLEAVHRNVSLLALAFLTVHILTAVMDPFAPIRLIDAVIPFTSAYRPVWLGLGAVAFDLLLAVTVTSLLRRRFGLRAWRAVHWLAYASWPIALVHGFGTGSDANAKWFLALTIGSVLVVLAAVAARVSAGWPDRLGTRVSALTAAALVPLGLLVWLPSGPLAAGWAKRAGTPGPLIGSSSATSTRAPTTSFTAQASGTVEQATGDEAQVHISLMLAGERLSRLGIRIFGRPAPGGGIEMSSSRVALGTAGNRDLYTGVITALNGTEIQARVAAGATSLNVKAQLQIDIAGKAASGTVAVSPG
jgi:DMSO/TMAO reductase YedYZ heme-binding membrane subunit